MYTILDILDKLIDIEKRAYDFYREIAEKESFEQPIKTMAKVLAREEKRHIKIYEDMKEELKDKKEIDIDFEQYDQIYKVLSTFIRRLINIDIENTDELLKYALDFEKENLALVIRIQGILVRNLEDENSKPYVVLSKLIQEETKHIENIERFIK